MNREQMIAEAKSLLQYRFNEAVKSGSKEDHFMFLGAVQMAEQLLEVKVSKTFSKIDVIDGGKEQENDL